MVTLVPSPPVAAKEPRKIVFDEGPDDREPRLRRVDGSKSRA